MSIVAMSIVDEEMWYSETLMGRPARREPHGPRRVGVDKKTGPEAELGGPPLISLHVGPTTPADAVSQSETRRALTVWLSDPMAEPTALAARELTGPAARRLADLAAVFDDLQFVLGCCERLLRELARGDEQDPVVTEALWAAALNAYARSFRAGDRDAGLTVEDLTATGLQGDLVPWHDMLGKLRNYLVAKAANPRETFSVGVSVPEDGTAE